MAQRWREVGGVFVVVAAIILFKIWYHGALTWPLHWEAIRWTVLWWGAIFLGLFVWILGRNDQADGK